jgi:MFS family permease
MEGEEEAADAVLRSAYLRHYWLAAAILGCCYTVAFIDRALVGVVAIPIKHDLSLSDFQFGLLSGTAFALLYSICGIPLGYIADRISRRGVIFAGVLFWSVMTLLSGVSQNFAGLAFARIGVGLGEACLLPAGMSLLSQITPRKDLGKVVAIFLIGATLGNVIALLGGGYGMALLETPTFSLPFGVASQPWRILFVLASIPGLLLAWLVLLIRDPRRPTSFSPSSLANSLQHLRAYWREYAPLTIATACNIILAQATAAWLPSFFVRHFGYSPSSAAILVGGMFLLTAPTGQWMGGIAIDYFLARGSRAPSLLLLSICCGLASILSIVFCTTSRLEISIAAYVLFNFLVSAATPAGLAGWQIIAPPDSRGFVTAFLVSVVTLVGIGFGTPAIGLLSDNVFSGSLGPSMAIVLAFSGIVASAVASSGLKAASAANHVAKAPSISH